MLMTPSWSRTRRFSSLEETKQQWHWQRHARVSEQIQLSYSGGWVLLALVQHSPIHKMLVNSQARLNLLFYSKPSLRAVQPPQMCKKQCNHKGQTHKSFDQSLMCCICANNGVGIIPHTHTHTERERERERERETATLDVRRSLSYKAWSPCLTYSICDAGTLANP
jgi:hypothetical protein